MSDLKSDAELVQNSLQDKEQFLCLVERYEVKLISFVQRISDLSYEDTKDVVQDIFIKVYKNLNSFDSAISSFNSWIYRISRNEVISRFRKTKGLSFISLFNWSDETWSDIEIEIPDKLDLEKDFEKNLNKTLVQKILRLMKNEYRDILVLKYFEEKTYEEIWDILKLPLWTVASLVNRAKKQFKEKVTSLKLKNG